MTGQGDFPPMKPVRGDDVRQPRKPWWVVARGRGYALFLGILYPLVAVAFFVDWSVNGTWWILPTAVFWLFLAAVAWASYFWYRKAGTTGAKADRDDR